MSSTWHCSAGVSAGDAMGVLNDSARLAVAGLGTTKEAVDIATSAINAFGLQGDKAAGVYDVVFTAIKNGKTTLSQLSQGFGAVAGTVAQAGVAVPGFAVIRDLNAIPDTAGMRLPGKLYQDTAQLFTVDVDIIWPFNLCLNLILLFQHSCYFNSLFFSAFL